MAARRGDSGKFWRSRERHDNQRYAADGVACVANLNQDTGCNMSGELRALIVPDAHYTLFNAEREGLPEVIVVNDALLSFPHNDIFPWHLRISIDAIDLAENGMPTPDESAILFEVGDALEQGVLAGLTENGARNSLFLARSTWNTYRELYFMVHDPEITHQALQSLLVSRQWARRWEYIMSEDRAWEKAGYIFQLFARKRLENS